MAQAESQYSMECLLHQVLTTFDEKYIFHHCEYEKYQIEEAQ
jgi:hypothetical protein